VTDVHDDEQVHFAAAAECQNGTMLAVPNAPGARDDWPFARNAEAVR
jgi:hypothetical protein